MLGKQEYGFLIVISLYGMISAYFYKRTYIERVKDLAGFSNSLYKSAVKDGKRK
jgi:hypothetical protein